MPDKDKEILEENLEDVEETVEETLEETAEADAENTSPEADETEADAEEKESKSFAEKMADKKKAKADKKQDALKEKIDELEDKVKRQMAEFDNFRKRTEKEKTQMFETGAKSVIEKILPVVDNFERGLASVPEEEKGKGFADGMNMIYKQLMTELESIGVTPIEAVGQEFNPDFHNAVMHVEDDEVGENIVVEEFQKGYMYRDSVVRYSMVKVAN